MTTKRKIILGFVSMMIIIVTVSVLGYRALNTADTGLQNYRRLARINVHLSDALAAFNVASANMYRFMNFGITSYAEQAMKDTDEGCKLFEATLKEIQHAQRKVAAQHLLQLGQEYKAALTKLTVSINLLFEQFKTKVSPNRLAAEETLKFMANTAHEVKNEDMQLLLSQIGLIIADLRFATGSYIQTQDEADAKLLLDAMKRMKDQLGRMGTAIKTPAGQEAFNKLKAPMKGWEDALAGMLAAGRSAGAAYAELLKLRTTILKELPELNDAYDDQMRETGKLVAESNADGKLMLMTGSGIGIGVGLIAALLIVFGLIKVLSETGAFAHAIADGDFEAKINVHEKGEIGVLVDSLQQIPNVLQSIHKEFQTLEEQMERGELEAKGNPAAYKGGFAAVVTDANTILDRFLRVVENIPSPVVMLNKDLKLAYMNANGRNLCGADYKGKICKQVMAREDYGGPACGLQKAVETLRPASGATVAHPQGKNLDISYTAIPMLDGAGKLASMLQLITDLTVVKQAERTIRKVADQASTIANRVASSSEELSSQVEEVSRGAEQQRRRVESTAAAMTEMNSTVLEVAKNAGQAAEQSEATKHKAQDGADLVNRVVKSINMVNKVATTLQTNMQELGGQAESIGGVMNVISDIADQTNLLALNAAIEAARAGDAGRGFAVVADEVRKLAEKTMTATHEVGANIAAIQQSTRTNISEVNTAAKAITEATDLANTSGQALAEIVDLAAANAAVVTSIATAAEEQSATSEEISQAIEEINKIVGQTAAGMEQAANAVHDLSSTAQELDKVMAALR